MKVILSRKGFDSANGGIASPILPDGTLLSLPIPSEKGTTYPYCKLSYGDQTYKEIIKQLFPKFSHTTGHLDPDIRQGAFVLPAAWKPIWKPVFGQADAALTVLQNQNVGVGDIFLFFGWFKQTESGADGKLNFVRGAKDQHIIYGYLQIGEIATEKDTIQKYGWHPHATWPKDKNCLYVAGNKLSWDESKPGAGVFQYDKRLVLTKDGSKSKSCWDLPDFMKELTISGSYKDAWRKDSEYGEYYRAMDIGQEFVIQEAPAVEAWAKALIKG